MDLTVRPLTPPPPAQVINVYDPKLCFILDGFLALYGVIITGLFIKEKFFRSHTGADKKNTNIGNYGPLAKADPESGRRQRKTEQVYQDLKKRKEDDYNELPVKKERQRKNEQVYQGLSMANRETYDSLQMQPLPPPPPLR